MQFAIVQRWSQLQETFSFMHTSTSELLHCKFHCSWRASSASPLSPYSALAEYSRWGLEQYCPSCSDAHWTGVLVPNAVLEHPRAFPPSLLLLSHERNCRISWCLRRIFFPPKFLSISENGCVSLTVRGPLQIFRSQN